jgi:hypothetical protein
LRWLAASYIQTTNLTKPNLLEGPPIFQYKVVFNNATAFTCQFNAILMSGFAVNLNSPGYYVTSEREQYEHLLVDMPTQSGEGALAQSFDLSGPEFAITINLRQPRTLYSKEFALQDAGVWGSVLVANLNYCNQGFQLDKEVEPSTYTVTAESLQVQLHFLDRVDKRSPRAEVVEMVKRASLTIVDGGRCFKVHAESKAIEWSGQSFQRALLTVASNSGVWKELVHSRDRWVPVRGTGVYAKGTPPPKAIQDLRMFVSSTAAPAWSFCPSDVNKRLEKMPKSSTVDIDWEPPIVFSGSAYKSLSKHADNWDSRRFRFSDLPKRLVYSFRDELGSIECSFVVDAHHPEWKSTMVAQSHQRLSSVVDDNTHDGTSIVSMATSLAPGPFGKVDVQFQPSHRFEWEIRAPSKKLFALTQLPGVPTIVEVRLQLDLLKRLKLPFEEPFTGMAFDVQFTGSATAENVESLPYGPRWFHQVDNFTFLDESRLSLMGAGVVPVLQGVFYFRTMIISLLLPSEETPEGATSLIPRHVDVGFRFHSTDATDLLKVTNLDVVPPVIVCPDVQSAVLAADEDVHAFD